MKYVITMISVSTVFLIYQNYRQSQRISHLSNSISQVEQAIIPAEPELLPEGALLPDFNLINTENKTVSLDKLPQTANKVFVFSAVGCPYCEDYYPQLEKFVQAHNDIPVILVQEGASATENKQFQEDRGYSFEVLAGNDAVFDEFMISGTPTTIVVDGENRVLRAGYFNLAKQIEEALL